MKTVKELVKEANPKSLKEIDELFPNETSEFREIVYKAHQKEKPTFFERTLTKALKITEQVDKAVEHCKNIADNIKIDPSQINTDTVFSSKSPANSKEDPNSKSED